MRLLIMTVLAFVATHASATIVSISSCSLADPASNCLVNTGIPSTVFANPNNDQLITWDETQNFTLTADLRVDRVFDASADFVTDLGNGDFLIKKGTIISSHYIQWDSDGAGDVQATIDLDSQVFGFITSRSNLLNSDYLGRTGVTYLDFSLRGSEAGDLTTFNGANTDIDWFTTNPGDWARLITAYSPIAAPEPGMLALMGLGLFGLGFKRRKTNS